jgi:hypothetical protein
MAIPRVSGISGFGNSDTSQFKELAYQRRPSPGNPMLANRIISFYSGLVPPQLPDGVDILHPQPDQQVMDVVKTFFEKFYSDNKQRTLILGINPGRFGAGITGINFTAPRQLTNFCGISHPWGNSSELSAEFIYEMIALYGGPSKFYSDYFIGAMSPLGFVKNGKNINYYDDKELLQAVKPFILDSLHQQLQMGFTTSACICIGGEKNYRFLSALNEKYGLFKNIIPLPHPRFIMQYRRKNKQHYLEEYLTVLQNNFAV